MDIMLDKNNINLVQNVASASTLISSLTGEARDYILSKFPKDYFKSVYMDTSLTTNQEILNRQDKSGAYKILYPSLSITPEISLDDPIMGDKNYHMSDPNLYLRREVHRNYLHILRDPDKKFGVYYTADNITTNFHFKITVDSYIKNIDTVFYLKSKFQKDFFTYLNNVPIQTEIPKTFIKIASNLNSFDLEHQQDMEDFQLYLMSISKAEDMVVKKKNLSTGKDSFFFNNSRNLLTLFTDLNAPGSIIRSDHIEGEYVIEFRLQVTTWLPNAFIMNIDKKVFDGLDEEVKNQVQNPDSEDLDTGFMTTSVGFIKLTEDTINFEDLLGKSHVGHIIYKNTLTAELNETGSHIKLLDEMKPEFKRIHAYVKDKFSNDELSALIHIKMIDRRGEVKDKYDFDIKNMIVNFSDLQNDVIVAVYLNRLMFEAMSVSIEKDVFFANDGVLSALYIRTDENKKSEKVRIKRFIDNDFHNSDVDKSLRIKTAYGIGFIDINNIKDHSRDAYKICVGYDKDEKPIIRKLNSIKRR